MVSAHSGGSIVPSRFGLHLCHDLVGMVSIPNSQLSARRERYARIITHPRTLIVCAWLLQFLLISSVIFFTGTNAVHGLVSLQLSPERMVEIYGFADAGSYLQAALNLLANGKSTPEWAWVLNLWPPGMVGLDAAIIKFSPFGFGTTIGLANAALWATALTAVVWPLLRTKVAVAIVLVAELVVLASSPFQSWMLDEGLFYAAGLASAAFILGLALVVNRAVFQGGLILWLRDGTFAGIAFATAVYFRASYNLIPWALGIVVAIIGIAIVVRRRRNSPSNGLGRQAALLVTAGLTMGALMLPYTVYLANERGRVQFVQTEELVYQHAWEDPSFDSIPQWMIDGGSTVGCDIAPEQCAEFRQDVRNGRTHAPHELRDALVRAILSNPGEFVGNRVAVVASQWFGDEIASYSRTAQNHESGNVSYSGSHNYNPPQGYLYLLMLLGACVAAVALAKRGHWVLLIVPVAALAILAPFAIVHVEVRYLIPLKLIALLGPTLVFAWKAGHLLRSTNRAAEDQEIGVLKANDSSA